MVKKEIDSVDLKILRILQDEGRISNLDPSKLGYDLVAWIFVSLKNQNEESLGSFEKLVWGWEPIRECFMLNGEIDFILKCVVKNMNEFNNNSEENDIAKIEFNNYNKDSDEEVDHELW